MGDSQGSVINDYTYNACLTLLFEWQQCVCWRTIACGLWGVKYSRKPWEVRDIFVYRELVFICPVGFALPPSPNSDKPYISALIILSLSQSICIGLFTRKEVSTFASHPAASRGRGSCATWSGQSVIQRMHGRIEMHKSGVKAAERSQHICICTQISKTTRACILHSMRRTI